MVEYHHYYYHHVYYVVLLCYVCVSIMFIPHHMALYLHHYISHSCFLVIILSVHLSLQCPIHCLLAIVVPLIAITSQLIREQAVDSQWRVDRRRKGLGEAPRLGELPRSHVQTLSSNPMFIKVFQLPLVFDNT
jgi:hypothetical protein